MDRFDRRVVVVAPGEARAYVPGEWRDALVVVEHGAVEVEDDAGGRVRFGAGAPQRRPRRGRAARRRAAVARRQVIARARLFGAQRR